MKLPHILLIARNTLYKQPGGDTVQVEQTAEHLRILGFHVDIALSGKDFKAENYEVVHFFNLIRPADIIAQLPKINRLIVSSIYVDYSDFERYHGGVLRQLLHRVLGKFGVEYLKTLVRWFNGSDKFPGWTYLLRGQRGSINAILQATDTLITATTVEQGLIRMDFPQLKINFARISLGSEHFKVSQTDNPDLHIANVARVEGIKNQLGLIRAVNTTSFGLDIFGDVAGNQHNYLEKCLKEGGERINFKGAYTHHQLAHILPQYKVHALPSFFETTGLASLEALAAGCSIVVADHPIQKELFGERAHYCNPSDHHSIQLAIEEAMKDRRDQRNWARENFSWDKAARKISDIYLKPQV